ncbi:MAG: hypothetical protein OEU86_08090 [Gammaproteobacteria bacterium]|nr:hypothetical protein [Gammaproteobacteria bacterium]
MKTALTIALLAASFAASAQTTNENLELKNDAYGLGVDSDQYGRPWQKSDPNMNLQKDAYGPGVHADQYGRPIQQQPPSAEQPFGQLKPAQP